MLSERSQHTLERHAHSKIASMSGLFIRELRIQNYKCFSDHQIRLGVPDGKIRGSGLTLLIGENGNGKTAVLEAVHYANSSSFAAENRLSINDFGDRRRPIVVTALTNDFVCKLPAPYIGSTFDSEGIVFTAKARDKKSPGKLLSSPFSLKTIFKAKHHTYRKKNGDDSGNPIPPLHLQFSNASILGNELNVFFFDKNRTRQISSGTYKTTFERICDDLNWKFLSNLGDARVDELLENVSREYFDRVLAIAQKGTGAKLGKL